MKILNKDFAEKLIEIIDDYKHNYGEDKKIRITNNYSGRFMYGKLCFGIVGEQKDIRHILFQTLRNMIEDNWEERNIILDEYEELISSEQVDNMGLQYIIYFPGWQLPKNIDLEE